MHAIAWLVSKATIEINDTDYTLATFTGKLAYTMIRDACDYCKAQGARYIDGKRSTGYNLVVEEREGYRKSIVLMAGRDNRVEFQVIEEREG